MEYFSHNYSINDLNYFIYSFDELNNSTSLRILQSGKDLPNIDELYNKAIKAGALGGKLLGAGGGGFLLFYVEKDKQQNVLKALDNLMYVPFEFESEGTTVIHYNPIVYIPRKEIKID